MSTSQTIFIEKLSTQSYSLKVLRDMPLFAGPLMFVAIKEKSRIPFFIKSFRSFLLL